MFSLAKVTKAVAVLALAGVFGILIGWLVSREGAVQPMVIPPSTNPPPILLPVAPPVAESARPAGPPAAAATPDPALALNAGPAEWEQQLDDVLLSNDDDNTKADRILALIPTAPPDAQVELSQHLVNMVRDDHYDGAAQMLTNATTPSAVSSVLMNDLLNRNNTLKLPMLLAVARQDVHPLKDQAREMLELLIQEDNGTNWDQWGASIDTWLQNNPE
jgi:pimeloyl-ACP methyl ester carboxylesterase